MTTTRATVPTATWRNRITGSGEEAPDQLLANPANWRIHPKAQQDALAGALDAVGWVQQVLVNRRSGFVVDDHARVALALRRGEAGGAWRSHPQRWAIQSRNTASLTSPLAIPRITWSVSSGSPGAGIQVRPLRSTNSTVARNAQRLLPSGRGGS